MSQRKQSPKQKERKRIKDREYYLRNKEKILSQSKSYRDSHKESAKEYSKKYREENKEKLSDDKKKYYKKHADVFKDRVKKWTQNNMERVKKNQTNFHIRNAEEIKKYHQRLGLKKKYGITEEEYQSMLSGQGGVCAICGKPPKTRRLSVDHEHQSRDSSKSPESKKVRIRGLLCHRCNRAIGLLGNDMNILLFASKNFAEYMQRYYIKRLVEEVGLEEAKKIMDNTVTYLEDFEKRLHEI